MDYCHLPDDALQDENLAVAAVWSHPANGSTRHHHPFQAWEPPPWLMDQGGSSAPICLVRASPHHSPSVRQPQESLVVAHDIIVVHRSGHPSYPGQCFHVNMMSSAELQKDHHREHLVIHSSCAPSTGEEAPAADADGKPPSGATATAGKKAESGSSSSDDSESEESSSEDDGECQEDEAKSSGSGSSSEEEQEANDEGKGGGREKKADLHDSLDDVFMAAAGTRKEGGGHVRQAVFSCLTAAAKNTEKVQPPNLPARDGEVKADGKAADSGSSSSSSEEEEEESNSEEEEEEESSSEEEEEDSSSEDSSDEESRDESSGGGHPALKGPNGEDRSALFNRLDVLFGSQGTDPASPFSAGTCCGLCGLRSSFQSLYEIASRGTSQTLKGLCCSRFAEGLQRKEALRELAGTSQQGGSPSKPQRPSARPTATREAPPRPKINPKAPPTSAALRRTDDQRLPPPDGKELAAQALQQCDPGGNALFATSSDGTGAPGRFHDHEPPRPMMLLVKLLDSSSGLVAVVDCACLGDLRQLSRPRHPAVALLSTLPEGALLGVVHLTRTEIMQTEEYRHWMEGLPGLQVTCPSSDALRHGIMLLRLLSPRPMLLPLAPPVPLALSQDFVVTYFGLAVLQVLGHGVAANGRGSLEKASQAPQGEAELTCVPQHHLGLRASARTLARLNTISWRLFPLPPSLKQQQQTPTSASAEDMAAPSTECAQVLLGRPLMRIVRRGTKWLSPDFSACPGERSQVAAEGEDGNDEETEDKDGLSDVGLFQENAMAQRSGLQDALQVIFYTSFQLPLASARFLC